MLVGMLVASIAAGWCWLASKPRVFELRIKRPFASFSIESLFDLAFDVSNLIIKRPVRTLQEQQELSVTAG